MPYCTQSDLLKRISEAKLIQLTDDDDAGIIDTDVIAEAVADADAEIDSYCGNRYSVPFTTVPAIILKLSVDITIYNLYGRRKGAPKGREDRYDNAIKFLTNVSKGTASLGEDDPAVDADGGPEATVKKSDRIFTVGRDSDGSAGSLDNY